MFCAVWRAAVASARHARVRSGKAAAKASACMPPMEPPTQANSVPTPRWSSSAAWARTMSPTVITGKFRPYARSMAGSSEDGPVEPPQPPTTLAHTTKRRSLSIGRPGPTMRGHQPGRPLAGCGEATCWSPVRAWWTSTALERSALSRP